MHISPVLHSHDMYMHQVWIRLDNTVLTTYLSSVTRLWDRYCRYEYFRNKCTTLYLQCCTVMIYAPGLNTIGQYWTYHISLQCYTDCEIDAAGLNTLGINVPQYISSVAQSWYMHKVWIRLDNTVLTTYLSRVTQTVRQILCSRGLNTLGINVPHTYWISRVLHSQICTRSEYAWTILTTYLSSVTQTVR